MKMWYSITEMNFNVLSILTLFRSESMIFFHGNKLKDSAF